MPISSGSSLSSAILGLLYLEGGGTSHLRNAGNYTRKRYVVKHNLITEVCLMTVSWKQLHVSANTGRNM